MNWIFYLHVLLEEGFIFYVQGIFVNYSFIFLEVQMHYKRL